MCSRSTEREDAGLGTALTTNVGHENRVLCATERESPVSMIPSLSQSTAMPGSASSVGEEQGSREPPTGALVLSRGDRSQVRYSPRTSLALIERATRAPGPRLRTPSVFVASGRHTYIDGSCHELLDGSVASQAWLNQPQPLVTVDGDDTAVEGKVAPRAEAETGIVVGRIHVEERDLFERAVGDVPRVVDA
jgi:hypothetical protein